MTVMPDFTPRNVTKYVVRTAIGLKAADLAEDVITEHTDFESDDILVKLSTGVIGWYVSARVKPYTDKAVDKTADFIVLQRVKRQDKKAKKNATK